MWEPSVVVNRTRSSSDGFGSGPRTYSASEICRGPAGASSRKKVGGPSGFSLEMSDHPGGNETLRRFLKKLPPVAYFNSTVQYALSRNCFQLQ